MPAINPPEKPWRGTRQAAGILGDGGLEFAHNCKFLCVGQGRGVGVFSAVTGRLLRTMDSGARRGSGGRVSAIARHLAFPMQMFVALRDGIVEQWNYDDGTLLSSTVVSEPIHAMAAHPTLSTHLLLLVGRDAASGLVSVDRRDGSVFEVFRSAEETPIVAFSSVTGVETVAVATARSVMAANVLTGEKAVFAHGLADVTAVAMHPSGQRVAVGDARGAVTTYFTSADTKTVAHWHSHAVSALEYSQSGLYLLSGGSEGVLLLTHTQTQQRTFLPRLGAAIRAVAVAADDSAAAVALANNAVVTVDLARMAPAARLRGLQVTCAPSAGRVLAFEPRRGQLCVSGERGALQFWDPRGMAHVSALKVAPHNVKLAGRTATAPPQTFHAAFSGSGAWLVTVDGRRNQKYAVEIYLKFWRWDAAAGAYALHTRIECPHGMRKVTSLAVGGDGEAPLVVTTGRDGAFKLWELHDSGARASWRCLGVGAFRSGVPCDGAALSSDGSLLAAAFGACITLWDPAQNRLLQTLPVGAGEQTRVSQLAFVPHSPFLISVVQQPGGGACELVLWDLVSCSCVWARPAVSPRVAVPAVHGPLGSDSLGATRSYFVVADLDGDCARIELFVPGRQLEGPVAQAAVDGAVQLAAVEPVALGDGAEVPPVALLMADGRLVVLDDGSSAEGSADGAAFETLGVDGGDAGSVFASLYGVSADSRVSGGDAARAARGELVAQLKASQLASGKLSQLEFLRSSASHVLPPVDTWCFEYWNSVLAPSRA